MKPAKALNFKPEFLNPDLTTSLMSRTLGPLSEAITCRMLASRHAYWREHGAYLHEIQIVLRSLNDLVPSIYTITNASLDKVRRCVAEDMRNYEIFLGLNNWNPKDSN